MGCLPSTKRTVILKQEHLLDIEEEQINDKATNENKMMIKEYSNLDLVSQRNLKINKEQFIQEYSCNPYLKYDRVEILGEGSYGKVFKVVERGNKVFKAIKEIKRTKKSPYEQEKLIKEINILKKLDHPNILKVFEFYSSEDYFYIVTEFCQGGELFDKIIQCKHFSEKNAVHVMKQLLSAVRFCHEHNIIHRDLKPENILIETEGNSFNIKVIDFGTGEITKSKFLTKQIGTPYYIAPEVLNNKYNEKCDIWSCGVIMYILLSGCPPFYGKNDEEIYAAVRTGKFHYKQKIWSEVSDDAKNLIKSLLDLDMNKRPTAEKAMKHKWFNLKNPDDDHETDNDSSITPIKNSLILKDALKNLKNFKAERKLQQATLYFMVHNFTPTEDINKLRKIFQKIDENNDGKLAKEELLKCFKMTNWTKCSEQEIEDIMKRVDVDGSGYIEFQEFLFATLDIKKILTEENLQNAFKMFDKDSSGKISAEELRLVLGVGNEKSDIRVWTKIITEIDSNGDGEISFDEFKLMMSNLVATV